jgi:predicted ATPase/DNA-binding winged helix-turn-helix (wHTH) protein
MPSPHDPVTKDVIAFGPFRLSAAERLIERAGEPVQLGGRAMDLLIALVERAGDVISQRELIDRVWPNVTVDEGSLRFHIATLRKFLGDGQDGARYVVNVPGRGYCFVRPTTRLSATATTPEPISPPTALGDLPAVLTRPIGREQIIAEIADRLPQRRFISIIGAGGLGKTTVAVAVAERIAGSYRHGVRFVDLAPVGESRFVPSVLARVFGLSIVTDDPIPSLLSHLRNRQMLIVLDNCDHVVEASALIAEALLKGAPGVSILTTSREALRAEGEVVHRLGALGVPPASTALTAATALGFPAVQLFVQRATANDDTFVLSDEEASIVADICRHLDGIPLAIELGAARIDALGVRGLAARIEDRFALLMKGRRTALPRHQTLRAMLDWSFDRLNAAEQYLLMVAAVFRAPFCLTWAIEVATAAHGPAFDMTDALEGLLSKSLVTSHASGRVVRFRLLELTRLYGLERLREQGDARRVRRLHAEHMLSVLENADLDRADVSAAAWFDAYPYAVDEVRAALDWAFSEDGDAELGCALTAAATPIWNHYTLMEECCARVERALRVIGPVVGEDPRRDLHLNAAFAAAWLHARAVDPAMGEAWRRAAALAELLDDADYKLRCLWGLWVSLLLSGDFRGALDVARRFRAIPDETVPLADLLVGDRLLGIVHHVLGHHATARQHIEFLLDRYVAPADQSHRVRYQFDQRVAALSVLGPILWVQGLPDQAMRTVSLAVDEAKATGHVYSMFYALYAGACPSALLCGDLALADKFIELQREAAAKNDHWNVWADCATGVLLIERGDLLEGIRLLRDGLSSMPTAGFQQHYVWYLGVLAVGTLAAGDPDGATKAIEEALQQSDRNEDRWCVAELLRIKGEIALSGGRDADAAALFQNSFDWSRRQGALSWELRTATSLARLRCAQGRPGEGITALAPIYGRFIEGFRTADLIQARNLLEALHASTPN